MIELFPQFSPALEHSHRYHRRALAALEPVYKANGFDYSAWALPDGGPKVFTAGQQLDQRISLLPLTCIWGISGTSSAAAGFRVQITDLGAQGAKFFSGKIDNGNVSPDGMTVLGITGGLYVLPTPYIVAEPGMFSVTFENLAAVANTVQLVLHCAEPAWLRPGALVSYNPNDWNKEIERAADLWKHAIRNQAPGASSSASGTGAPGAFEGELTNAPINVSVLGDNVIVPGVPGSKIEIYELFIWNVAGMTIQLRAGADLLSGPLTAFPATSGVFLPFTGEPHFDQFQDGASFILNLSAATQVSGWVRYRMVS